MVVLARVKVALIDLVLAACPDDRQTQTHRETRLKVDPLTVSCDIGDQKSAPADFSNDLVTNLVVELLHVDPEGSEASIPLNLHYSLRICCIHLIAKPHRHEGLFRIDIRGLQGFHALPTQSR